MSVWLAGCVCVCLSVRPSTLLSVCRCICMCPVCVDTSVGVLSFVLMSLRVPVCEFLFTFPSVCLHVPGGGGGGGIMLVCLCVRPSVFLRECLRLCRSCGQLNCIFFFGIRHQNRNLKKGLTQNICLKHLFLPEQRANY